MSRKVELDDILFAFGVQDIKELKEHIDNSSPSLCEYTIENIAQDIEDEYINKSFIEHSISVGDIVINFDYAKECYIDLPVKSNDEEEYSLF